MNNKSLSNPKTYNNLLGLEFSDIILYKVISAFLWLVGCYSIAYHLIDFYDYTSLISFAIALIITSLVFSFDIRFASYFKDYSNLNSHFELLAPRVLMSLLVACALSSGTLVVIFNEDLDNLIWNKDASSMLGALMLFLSRDTYVSFFAILLALFFFIVDFSGTYFEVYQKSQRKVKLKKIDEVLFSSKNITKLISSLFWAVGGFYTTYQFIDTHPNTSLIAFCVALLVAAFTYSFDLKVTAILEERSNSQFSNNYSLLAFRALMSLLMSYFFSMAILTVMFDRDLQELLWTTEARNKIVALGKFMGKNSEISLIAVLLALLLFLVDFAGTYSMVFLGNRQKVIHQQKKIIISQAEEIRQSSEQQIQIIASIQHELGNKLPAAKNYFADLLRGLQHSEENSSTFSLQHRIREVLPGEDESEVDSFDDIIKKIDSSLNYSISIVDNIGGIVSADPSRFKPESRSLLTFILEHSNGYPSHANFKIAVIGDDLMVDFDPKQIGVLLDNIISNAIRHSFVDKNKNYHMLFELIAQGDQIDLYIKNDGAPFEKDFSIEDYVTVNKFAGKNGNSGIGGYLVGLILRNHKGRIELLTPSSAENFNVNLKISLPINQKI